MSNIKTPIFLTKFRFLVPALPQGSESKKEGREAKKSRPLARNRDFYKIIEDNDHNLLCIVITDHIMKTGVSSLQNPPS